MQRYAVFFIAFFLVGCAQQIPQRTVVFESSSYLKVKELVLEDGSRVPVLSPIIWDTNTQVFRDWANVGNITQLKYKDLQGRNVVGDFFCVYQKSLGSQPFAALAHAIRYRADGTREIETHYQMNGSPTDWVCYSADGQHKTLHVKQRLDKTGVPCLQWVAVADGNGKLQSYGLEEGETGSNATLRVGRVDVNESLE